MHYSNSAWETFVINIWLMDMFKILLLICELSILKLYLFTKKQLIFAIKK